MKTRNHRALIVLFAALGCSSSPSETPMTTTADDSDDDDTGDSVTEGITLSNSSTADGSTGDSSAESNTDPDTTLSGSEETTSADAESSGPETTDPSDSSSSGDSAESSSTDPTRPDTGNTIYEVQDGTLPEDSAVEINNVVVTGVVSNGIYVQEPAGGEYSGVFVFSVDGPDISGAQLGDIVNVSGITGEYMDNTEVDITLGTYELVDSGTPLDAEVVGIATLVDDVTGEPWESVLVRIEGDLQVTTVAASNEFTIASGADEIDVDDFLYELPTAGDFAGFDVGASFTAIQGPLNYFNNEFKIAGRGPDDFEGYAAP